MVSLGNMNGTTDGVFSEEVDMLLDALVVRQTLLSDMFYWQLPIQFLGDKVSKMSHYCPLNSRKCDAGFVGWVGILLEEWVIK